MSFVAALAVFLAAPGAFSQEAPAEETAEAPAPADPAPEPEAPAEVAEEPAESAPATPAGEKSLDDYKDQLRRLSANQNFEEVIKLTEEIEKLYPNDESVKFFRTRAEKSMELEATRERIKKRAESGAADSVAAEATPEATPVPVESAGTPVPELTRPPVAPLPPLPPIPKVQTTAAPITSSRVIPIVVGVLVTGGALLLFVGLLSFKKKKPASSLPPMAEEDYMHQGDHEDAGHQAGFASQGHMQPSPRSHQPSPAAAWDADPLGGPSSPMDDDLFSPSASSPKGDGGIGSDIFNEPPSSPRPARAAAHTDDTADQSNRFQFFDSPAPSKAAPVAQAPVAEDPIRFDMDSAAPGGFDTPKSKPAPKVTPWTGGDEMDSFPMVPPEPGTTRTAAPPPAEPVAPAATTGGSSKAPWESRSATATDKGKQASFTLPEDDSLSLPAFDVASGMTGASSRTETKTSAKPTPPTPEFPTFGDKAGVPSFAEMNLNAIKSPEFSETVVGMDMGKAADTNPGFDIQPSDAPKAASAKPQSPSQAVPPMPGNFGESTVILSKRELSDDPDLFLQSTQFGIPKTKPAPEPQPIPERFKEFKADETIGINFGAETAPTPKAAKPAEAGKPKDNFDRERELGLQAFKDAEWDKAVYHLSIAAALRPEATDIKEQLRRARRMRKEKESGGAS